MDPKIVESFWTDADFERYEGQDLALARITFLWLFGGPNCCITGIRPLNTRNFALDVGLGRPWIDRVLQDFPRAFLFDAISGKVLSRHFIRYNFGIGEKLARNHMCPPIIEKLRFAPRGLAWEVLRTYPELSTAVDHRGKPYLSPTEALAKGMASPTEALAKGMASPTEALTNENTSKPATQDTPQTPESSKFNSHLSHVEQPNVTPPAQALGKPLATPPQGVREGDREREGARDRGSAEGGGDESRVEGRGSRAGNEVVIPSLAEVIACGDRAGIDRATCQAFFDYHESRGWMSGHTPLRKPLSLLAGYAAERQTIKKPGSSRHLDSAPDADALRAQLQTEKNPDKRAGLEKRLATLNV